MTANYKLGPLPWSRDTLIGAYRTNWVQATENIKEHPGFAAQEGFDDVKLTLGVFIDYCDDFLRTIANIKNTDDANLFSRGNRQNVELWDRTLRRHLFGVASSAFALVDTSRRVSRAFPIQGYQEEVAKYFVNSELHHFIQGLRNFATHKKDTNPLPSSSLDRWGKVHSVNS